MQQVVFVTYGDRDDGSDNDDEGDGDDHGDGDDGDDGDGDEDKAAPFSIVVKPQAGFDRDERAGCPAGAEPYAARRRTVGRTMQSYKYKYTNTQMYKYTNTQILCGMD